MKKCAECKSQMQEKKSKTEDGVEYTYYACSKCGDEILDMEQLHEVANKYRQIKQHRARVSKWGASLGLRIPKELARKYHIKADSSVFIIPEEKGMKIIPSG